MHRVLVTRAPHQASPLAQALRNRGCEPILIPTIEIVPPASWATLDEALAQLERFHWVLFTSANAVEAFAQRRSERQARLPPSGSRLTHPCRIAAIGPATARALESVALHVDLIPEHAVAESLAAALLACIPEPDGTPTRVLLVRAQSARDIIPDTLRAAGAHVTIAPAYRTVIPESSIATLQQLFRNPAHYPDAVTFTSSSTATNLFALLGAAGLALPTEIVRASIGPITSQTLRDAGHPPHLEASETTSDSLAEALATYLQRR